MASLADFERYSRQTRLAEVGAEGQARIAAATLSAPRGAEVERMYLERAGVGQVRVGDGIEQAEFRHASAFRHPAAANLGAQAWRALDALRGVLGVAG